MLNIRNKSHSITAELAVPDQNASGVIVNQGGTTGGWTLYVKNGRLCYGYSFCGFAHTTIRADTPVPAGDHQVRVEFAYDGGGLGKGGTATLYVDGQQAGSGRVPRTHPLSFSLDETTDVGRNTGAPVTPDYPVGDNGFTGTVNWVRLELGDDSHDHLIDAHDLLHLAMTKQ